MNTTTQKFLALYERQGKVMRDHGKFDGAEEGVCLVVNWAGIKAIFVPWAVFAQMAQMGAFYVQRMSDAATPDGEEWYHLRPQKLPLKMALHATQGEWVEVRLADCTSTQWKADHKAWIPAGGKPAHWNLGWYAEYRVCQHFGLDWSMNRNRRTKGVADMVLTDSDGKRHHWEVKDLVGAGFQIRPERAHELGLDDLCTD